jgi:hypothetical protein
MDRGTQEVLQTNPEHKTSLYMRSGVKNAPPLMPAMKEKVGRCYMYWRLLTLATRPLILFNLRFKWTCFNTCPITKAWLIPQEMGR